jgi:hypothetical protein
MPVADLRHVQLSSMHLSSLYRWPIYSQITAWPLANVETRNPIALVGHRNSRPLAAPSSGVEILPY